MIEGKTHFEVSVGSDRKFGITFAVVFVVIGLLPLLGGGGVRLWAFLVALLFLAVAIVRPALLKPLNIAWFKFGMLLGRVVSPIVTGLIFFVAVLPTALLMRALGKDPLALAFDRGAATYWVARDPTQPPHPMKNQF
jgi:hypothetical protein